MRPDIDISGQLAAELAARKINATMIADECSPSPRTMRAYVKGDLPLPPPVAREIIAALDDRGPFALPQVREALVIRGRAHDSRRPPNQVEPRDLRVDTVVLTLEVDATRRDEVAAFLRAHLPSEPKGGNRLRGYRAAAHARVPDDLGPAITAHWSHRSPKVYWLRLQLAPWEPAHCRLLQRLLRCASRRTAGGLIAEGPVLRLARLDVALNYMAEPRWLILNRPLAPTARRIESKDAQVTYYAGSREGCDLLIRLYDYARHHQKPGPVARIEAELHFRRQILPAQLEAQDNPFRVVELGLLFCPELTFTQAALLHWARDVGIRWALKQLDQESPEDAARLRDALQKAADSPLLESPSEIMDRVWRYMPELLRTQLFWRETEDGDLQPWSYPPVLSHDEMAHDSGEART